MQPVLDVVEGEPRIRAAGLAVAVIPLPVSDAPPVRREGLPVGSDDLIEPVLASHQPFTIGLDLLTQPGLAVFRVTARGRPLPLSRHRWSWCSIVAGESEG